MLESGYESCLCHELAQAGIGFERQIGIPVIYQGAQFVEGSAPRFPSIAKQS
jgi:GxxExxY protein